MSEESDHSKISVLSKQQIDFYIIATPIGNLNDITLRALDTLKNVDLILCEDTRVTANLLSHHGIKTKTSCYNDFSDEKDRRKIIDLLRDGKTIALVSDAGTPLISDPGYKLVNEVRKKGFAITSLPGASSLLNSLALSGLPTNRFLFEGFLPPKTESRLNALDDLKAINATLIFFESARRLIDSLNDMHKVLGEREVSIAREMTKQYEEVTSGSFSDVITYYEQNPPRGEIVIVISPPLASAGTDKKVLEEQLMEALKHMRLKDAVSLVAEQSGLRKKEVYDIALELTKKK